MLLQPHFNYTWAVWDMGSKFIAKAKEETQKTNADYRKYCNLVRTQVEIISDPNYLVRVLFER